MLNIHNYFLQALTIIYDFLNLICVFYCLLMKRVNFRNLLVELLLCKGLKPSEVCATIYKREPIYIYFYDYDERCKYVEKHKQYFIPE